MTGTTGLIKWIFQIHPFRNFVESYDSILGYSFTAPKLSVYLISFFETLINWSSFTQLGKTHLRSRIHRRKNEILWFSSVETSRLRGKKITLSSVWELADVWKSFEHNDSLCFRKFYFFVCLLGTYLRINSPCWPFSISSSSFALVFKKI